MKLACSQSDLNTNLSLIGRAVPTRPSHPVLANILLVADTEKQQVSLTAFDLSLGIRTSFPATIETGGILTLPAKLLSDIVSRLPEGEISLLADSEDTLVTLTASSGRYQVRGMGAEEFPELPVLEAGEGIHLPAEALIEGLRSSLFSTSADETKQVLTGVRITGQEDGLEFAATDGHRLAVIQTLAVEADAGDGEAAAAEVDADIKSLSMTVPARALRELERILSQRQSSDPVTLQMDRGQAIFECGDQRLTSRLLEGQYPNYNQLIPRQFVRQVTIDRRAFVSALERIAVIADRKNNVVKLSLDAEAQTLALSVDAQDVGSGQESINVQFTGESIDVAFNVRYLLDGLKVLASSDVQLQLNEANSPVILTPVGDIQMTYLVMPVQIRS